jgi:hypothetical protein
VKNLVAVREQGLPAFAQVEVACVELDEVSDQAHRRPAFDSGELADRGDQLGIRQMGRNRGAHGRALWKDRLPDLVR